MSGSWRRSGRSFGPQRVDTRACKRRRNHRFVDCPGSVDKMAVVEYVVSGDFQRRRWCSATRWIVPGGGVRCGSELPVVMYNRDMTSEQGQGGVDGDFQAAPPSSWCARISPRAGGFRRAGGKVEHVVNFDFPMNPIDYILERADRARGRDGEVTNLVTKKDRVCSEIDVAVNSASRWTRRRVAKPSPARQRKETLAGRWRDSGARTRGGGGGRAGRARRRARGPRQPSRKANRRRGRGRGEEPEGVRARRASAGDGGAARSGRGRRG